MGTIRTIIFLILIYIAYRVIKSLFYFGSPVRRKEVHTETSDRGTEMVFDPVCKSYVSASTALKVRNGDQVHYFCGEECRDEFIASLKK